MSKRKNQATAPPRRSRETANRGILWIAAAILSLVALWGVVRSRDRGSAARSAPDSGVRTPIAERKSPEPASALLGNAPEKKVASAILAALRGSASQPNRSTDEWIKIFDDPSQPMKLRRQAAQALAQDGSDTAFSALSHALTNGAPPLRAAIAEALGRCHRPDAGPLLSSLLEDADESTACGAVRGIAVRDPAEAKRLLGAALYDNQRPVSVRTEAALSLGSLEDPDSLRLLLNAASELKNEKVVAHVLRGIAGRPFAETEEFFSVYLDSPSLSQTLKVAALEAVGSGEGNTAALLFKYVTDENPEARAAAAWGMSASETPGDFGGQLTDLLGREQNPAVRTRLYQALGNQEDRDAAAVVALLQREGETEPRLAGYDLLAGLVKEDSGGEILAYFNQNAVPALRETALQSEASHERLASVIVLQKARTPEALNALQQIAQISADPKVTEAAKAALSSGARR